MSPDTTVDGLRILPTQHSVSQVLQRVESLARARGLTVFAQIDFSGDAERAGLTLRQTGLVPAGTPRVPRRAQEEHLRARRPGGGSRRAGSVTGTALARARRQIHRIETRNALAYIR
jgi:hypothetical protein